MPLTSGFRVGPYEVIELIGRGGMGEVYRARDPRLNRDVALKSLPELFAADPDRLARFKREAQVLASLNHPNIAAIYGLEESDSGRPLSLSPGEAGRRPAAIVRTLVLEFVDGPTLADRCADGPMPLDDALPIARQIALALEAAHEQGIIHRDLKPANVKVRPDGTVKVLDFGLSKALVADVVGPGVSQSPTITSPAATGLGVILGTAAYMSPEQARGKAADRRSDIWAFGCVLYEMLAGKRAFDGGDVSDALASILKSDPDWGALPADIPANVRRVLRRCLEKDPRQRLHDIADGRIDLDEKVATGAAAPLPAPRHQRRERIAWIFLVTALAGLLAYELLKAPPSPRIVRFQVSAPQGAAFGTVGGIGGGANSGTISPDGTRLAFVATDASGRTLLWLRALDASEPRPLPGTDGALFPFWSPDSRFIGFFAAYKLKKIDAAGGPPQTICDVPLTARGATWGTAGVIVFSSGNPPRLARVPADGGTTQAVAVSHGDQPITPMWPHFLPDGRHFLYWSRSLSGAAAGVSVGSIEDGFAPKRLVDSEANALYAAPGFLLYTKDNTLMRRAFDPERLELGGEPIPVAERILRNDAFGLASFSVSATGVLTFRSGDNVANQFAWLDRAGRLLEKVGVPGNYRTPALSPDEKRLAYTDNTNHDIWMLDLSRQTPSRFTSDPAQDTCPVWSPDGATVSYRSEREGGGVYQKNANGAGTERLLLKTFVNGPSQISSDGKLLLYFVARTDDGAGSGIFVLPLTGDRKPRAVVQRPFVESEPQLSPDGRWLAYAYNDTGRNEIYVEPFPTTGERWPVSNRGGRQAMWRSDGRELYFVSDDRKFYAVDIRSGPRFDFGTPHLLFDMRADVFNTRNSYVPSRDGQRFLVNMLLDPTDAPINVVLNWTAGSKN